MAKQNRVLETRRRGGLNSLGRGMDSAEDPKRQKKVR